jgi:mannose-6-phosphate isomerase
VSSLYRLENRIQPYAWGSHTSLASIRGAAVPTAKPEAELWMGAHPLAPSRALDGGTERTLLELISADPKATLGARVASSFGRLPFLMKLLAAREPLSLQAHPSEAQAKLGFAREEAAGIPLDAPTRSYKDPHHKPELIAALTPFSALVGFRTPSDTARLFAALGVRALAPAVTALTRRAPAEGLRSVFALVTESSPTLRRELADATLAACREQSGALPEFERELAWGVRIGELYPGDAGIVLALALNLVVLEPGQALYLPAGNLHAYLEGTGVEIMASSDNVLRGGLTPKHVDVPELLQVLDFSSAPAALVPTEQRGGELHYVTPAAEFALSQCSLSAQAVLLDAPSGPEIVVVTAGSAFVRRGEQRLELASGSSVFVPAAGGAYELGGAGTAFRARVNL